MSGAGGNNGAYYCFHGDWNKGGVWGFEHSKLEDGKLTSSYHYTSDKNGKSWEYYKAPVFDFNSAYTNEVDDADIEIVDFNDDDHETEEAHFKACQCKATDYLV